MRKWGWAGITMAGIALLSACNVWAGDVVFHDLFSDGGMSDGADLTDTAWNLTGSGVFAEVSNGVVQVDFDSTTYRGIFTTFDPVTLGNGDSLSLSLKVRAISSPAGDNHGLRLVFVNTGGGGSSPDWTYGYQFTTAWGSGTGGLFENASLSFSTYGVTPDEAMEITDTGWHTLVATIKRVSADEMKFSYILDGEAILDEYSYVDANGISTHTFNRLNIGNGASLQDFQVDDVKLTSATVFEHPVAVMPSRLFTSEVLNTVRQGGDGVSQFFWSSTHGDVSRADDWDAIPDATWTDIISECAPASLSAAGGTCPFCQNSFSGVTVDLANPLQGITRCCGNMVYADPADEPVGYVAPANHSEVMTLLDGTQHTYWFHVPAGAEGDRMKWLCAEGELWSVRMKLLLVWVIPDLSTRLLADTSGSDTDAAHTLAMIFDRLADVYPGLPFYEQGTDYQTYFTNVSADPAGDYVADLQSWWEPLLPYTGKITNPSKSKLLDYTSYGNDGRHRPLGYLAEAYDLLRHHPESDAYSLAKYGTTNGLDDHVVSGLFYHVSGWSRQYGVFTGNQLVMWLRAGPKIAVVTRDQEYLEKVTFYYESYLRNHFYSDGLSIEGAFNYSAMLGYLFCNPWIAEHVLGVDFSERYPLVTRICEVGDYPIKTLAGVESLHGDEHSSFFGSVQSSSPDSLDYDFISQNFPDYGLTCLRAGSPGSRMELMMDYQNSVLHCHDAALNLQLFYQGVNLLPDLGYEASVGDAGGYSGMDYPFELQNSLGFSDEVEGHCSGTALGSQFGSNSTVFERYLGLPSSPMQMAQVSGKFLYDTYKWPEGETIPQVNVFNRQIAAITLPSGRALALDFFRMDGGWRHDVFWHVAATGTVSSLGAPATLAATNLMQHYQANATPEPGWMQEATYWYNYYINMKGLPYFEGLRHFSNPAEWTPGTDAWRINWDIDPLLYEPITGAGQDLYGAFKTWLKPVSLNMWGLSGGTGVEAESTKLFAATVPFPGRLECGDLSRVAFKDGMQALVEHRQGTTSDLTSTFVHVFDPSATGQSAAVQSAEIRMLSGAGDMGAVVDVVTDDGEVLQVISSLSGGSLTDSVSQVSSDARIAMVMPEMATAVLMDGSLLDSDGMDLSLTRLPSLTLVDVVGDLSGQPDQSALIVDATGSTLPAGTALAGLTVNVQHQSSEAHVSAYEIKSITDLGSARYRIDLEYTPPFIRRKVTVKSFRDVDNIGGMFTPDAHSTNLMVYVSHNLHDGIGRPNGLHRNIRIPRSGFESTIKAQLVGGYAGWHSNCLVPSDNPTEGELEAGDTLLIYSMKAGDTVVIPEVLSCRPIRAADSMIICTVYSTGGGTVTFGGEVRAVSAGTQQIVFSADADTVAAVSGALNARLIDSGVPVTYFAWAVEHGLTGANSDMAADAESDGVNNLVEYALGGNPGADDAKTVLPAPVMVEENGTNWLYYIYSRPSDYAARGLGYAVESTADLAAPFWTVDGPVSYFGAGGTGGMETITNRLDTSVSPDYFMRLRIQKD